MFFGFLPIFGKYLTLTFDLDQRSIRVDSDLVREPSDVTTFGNVTAFFIFLLMFQLKSLQFSDQIIATDILLTDTWSFSTNIDMSGHLTCLVHFHVLQDNCLVSLNMDIGTGNVCQEKSAWCQF